ncbi:MAG TPA: hypothetical protein VIL85_03240 [Thermomicrobiales bacterium]|jgi:hypothetical protein
MMDNQQSPGWRFWAGWGLAFVGLPLGGLAASALVGAINSADEGLLAGAATGAVVGAAQWLALSRRLPLSPWWIAATSAGMAAGLALGIQLLGTAMDGNAVLLRGLLTGAGIGLAQTVLLHRTIGNATTPLWGAVVTVGWALGWLISGRVVGVDLTNWAVFGSTGAWAFQLLTGLTLAYLLRRAPAPAHRLASIV